MKLAEHESLDSVETMNISLLSGNDGPEWDRCYDQMWTWAITAARRFLFRNVYSEEDRRDVAIQVIAEFHKTLCRRRIRRCRNDEDVERWIWGRAKKRATDLRRKRKRERGTFDPSLPDGERNEGGGEGQERAEDPPVERQPISDEARVDELIAWARLMPAGFSMDEQAAYRAVVVRRLTEAEYAEESGKPPGTVAHYVSSAKHKIAALLEQEWRMFL